MYEALRSPSGVGRSIKVSVTHPMLAVPSLLDHFKRRIRIDVTGPAAVPQLAHGVVAIGILVLLVFVSFEIGCVTGRTIRLILRRIPCHWIAIAPVASRASEIPPVIAWVVRALMAIDWIGPARGGVALVTLECGGEMVVGYSRGLDIVVAF